MWGHRVVVTESLRELLLKELHVHMGVVRMKTLARSFIWWPKIDQDIENMSKSCELCLKAADNPPKANLHVWEWPQEPNLRIHADFLGLVDGRMYLIIIDAFSKWIDVKEMKNITADSMISAMREYICTWGIPLK